MWCVFLLCSDPSHDVAPMLSAGSETRKPRQRHNATRDNGTQKAEKKGFQDAGDCKKSDSSEFTGKRDLFVVKHFFFLSKGKITEEMSALLSASSPNRCLFSSSALCSIYHN